MGSHFGVKVQIVISRSGVIYIYIYIFIYSTLDIFSLLLFTHCCVCGW